MTRYKMQDSTIVDTANATQSWVGETRYDGANHISIHTGGQWTHQDLHRSRKGRYYIERTSQYQGSTPGAEWVSPQEAARWLLLNGSDLPADLAALADQVSE